MRVGSFPPPTPVFPPKMVASYWVIPPQVIVPISAGIINPAQHETPPIMIQVIVPIIIFNPIIEESILLIDDDRRVMVNFSHVLVDVFDFDRNIVAANNVDVRVFI